MKCCSGFQNKWIKNIMACCIDDDKDDNVIIKWLNQKERFFCPLKRVLWFNDFLRFCRLDRGLLVGEKENAYLVIREFSLPRTFLPLALWLESGKFALVKIHNSKLFFSWFSLTLVGATVLKISCGIRRSLWYILIWAL